MVKYNNSPLDTEIKLSKKESGRDNNPATIIKNRPRIDFPKVNGVHKLPIYAHSKINFPM